MAVLLYKTVQITNTSEVRIYKDDYYTFYEDRYSVITEIMGDDQDRSIQTTVTKSATPDELEVELHKLVLSALAAAEEEYRFYHDQTVKVIDIFKGWKGITVNE